MAAPQETVGAHREEETWEEAQRKVGGAWERGRGLGERRGRGLEKGAGPVGAVRGRGRDLRGDWLQGAA